MNFKWILVFFILLPYIVESFITGVAVRLWLQGNRVAPGAPWPLPQVWQNSTAQQTLDPQNFVFTTDWDNTYGNRAAPGAPWPLPQVWQNSTAQQTLDPQNFVFTTDSEECEIIGEAFERYHQLIFIDPDGQVDPDLEVMSQLTVTGFTCDDGYPPTEMDEYYTLTIGEDSLATLQSNTIWGVLRGLETFSQLVYLDENKQYHINDTAIEDYPRFGYRGLLIDTARHYLPVSVITDILDGMAWDKLNVLHWHIVDDQSFPFESRTFPNMSEYGAFSPSHVYTRQDVVTVIEEARLRGIRVIPEFDTPGHTYSWGKALPDLLTPCWGEGLEGGPYVPVYGVHGDMETINPSQEYTYEVLQQLMQEINQDFPDEYLHLGLDEAYYSCWQSNPNISEWMSDMGFTQYNQVEEYFINRLTEIAENIGSKYVVWQDPIDNNVTISNNSIVGVWKDSTLGTPGMFLNWTTYMERVTKLGYDAYLLGPWYLNVINYGQDWRNYYMVEPYSFTDDETLQQKVKGGEATAWAEYIDGTNIVSLLWPRTSAVAERLWSSRDVTDTDSAAFRLDQQRCRYVRRGLPAKPILPGYCGDYEWGM